MGKKRVYKIKDWWAVEKFNVLLPYGHLFVPIYIRGMSQIISFKVQYPSKYSPDFDFADHVFPRGTSAAEAWKIVAEWGDNGPPPRPCEL
jgi:hypothetical protein